VTKQLLVYVMCVGMLISAPTKSAAQATTPVREQITLRGTVQAVDAAARTVTIRGDEGNVVTLDVPQSVSRLNEVRAGDVVSAVYYDQVSVTPHPSGAPDNDRLEPPIATATAGALPGGTVAQRRVTTVTITAWDPATRVVTFTVPSGATLSRRLVETTDASLMAGLKVGDRVDVTRTEAVRLAVERAAQAPAPDDLRHRLTVSALVGWDNQFSGKMIQAATGRTIGGAPINLDETTYDEVYGRIGLFKLGVGYRTTPRTEGVVNFVWSKSDASDAATPVGTVGTSPQIPLNVNFTEYKYWGFEGGARWFFARTRFTPFVGAPRGYQPAPGHPWHVRRRTVQCHPRARLAGWQVLRRLVGIQPRPDRGAAHRSWLLRSHGRDTAPFHGRFVRRGLAGRRRLARCQQRERAVVVPDPGRRAHPVLRYRCMAAQQRAGQGFLVGPLGSFHIARRVVSPMPRRPDAP
jgi:hypothetical protein